MVLENWGFPITREKSDIGAHLRLAFVLDAWARQWALMSPEQREIASQHGESDVRDEAGCPPIGETSTLADLSDDPDISAEEAWREELRHLRWRFVHAAQKAKGAVLDHEETRPEDPPGRLHLASLSTLVAWRPPQERVVEWQDFVVRTFNRFGSACLDHTGKVERAFPSPSALWASSLATRLGRDTRETTHRFAVVRRAGERDDGPSLWERLGDLLATEDSLQIKEGLGPAEPVVPRCNEHIE